ncbi:MAG: CBS domain-containing protein [Desulfovibrionaceae bacterium]
MTNKSLRDLFTPGVIGVAPDALFADALRLMRSKRISCVVVLEKGMPVGIVTERNVLWAAAHCTVSAHDVTVRTVMSSPVLTVPHGTSVHDAYVLLTSSHVRHLVVVDERGLAVSVLTQTDLVAEIGDDYLAEVRTVASIMSASLVTGSPDTTLAEAVRLMAARSISCIVVVEDEFPVGIVTERDVVTFVADGASMGGLVLGDVMSRPVQTVVETMPAYEVALFMVDKPFRRVVVVDAQGRALSVVTQTDVVRGLESRYVSTLRTHLDRKTARLEEQSLFLDNMLRSAMDMGIMAVDHAFRITFCNPLAETLMGCTADEVLGRDVREFHVARGIDLSRLNRAIAVAAKESRYTFEFRHGQGDDCRILKAEVAGIWDAAGDPGGYLLMVRDITERRLAQERLADMNHHLEQLVAVRTRDLTRKAAELELANRRLLGLDELKSTFLSSVSHELRTPLTSLLGFVKLIRRDFKKLFTPLVAGRDVLERKADRVGDNLDIVVREGERLTRLINDFLDLSKIEAGQIEWHDREITVAELVEHAVAAVSGQFSQKPHVELVVEVAAELPPLQLDLDRMMQVMINLLNNAAKFTRQGRVTVRALAVDAGAVELRVEDTGLGIPADNLETVFNKYQQYSGADTLEPKNTKGTGLGLAICREIVLHYGGRIWAESVLGQGSAFVMHLPVAGAPQLGHAGMDRCGGDKGHAGWSEAIKPLILVVDGKPETCNHMERVLTDEGFRVIHALDAQAALELSRDVLPDLVLMELDAPGLEGGEAIRRLRRDAITSHIPVVVAAAFPGSMQQDRQARPVRAVDMDQLMVTVRGLLHGEIIRGRKCMLLHGPRKSVERDGMVMISSGRINYVQPDEILDRASNRFEGTIFLPADKQSGNELDKLAGMEDILVVIMPD